MALEPPFFFTSALAVWYYHSQHCNVQAPEVQLEGKFDYGFDVCDVTVTIEGSEIDGTK